MSFDEGYIKYSSHWTPGPPVDASVAAELDAWRRPLFDAGLIGQYRELGIGYGNLSVRCGESGRFVISGTQTGHLPVTTPEHYALVTHCDINANAVSCEGPVKASSEAMTHAAIYALDDRIGAIVHVHSAALWKRWIDVMPTTRSDVAYGTPEMAREFGRLFATTDFSSDGIAVMAGHEEGLISFGASLEEAATRILSLAG